MPEITIRRWKQLPAWEEERQKSLIDRAEALEEIAIQNKSEYLQELKQQQQNLKLFIKTIEANAALSLKLSNRALTELSREDNAARACNKATKAGAQSLSKNGIEAVKAIASLHEQIYQSQILIEHFEKMEERDQEIDTLDL